MSEYKADDGVRLLFIEEVADMLGVAVSTVRRYSTAAKQVRSRRKRAGPTDFPAPVRHVRRTLIKADGHPVAVRSPLWREDRIKVWLDNKRGPGGRRLRQG